jgi:hypothetical protein
MGPPCGTLIRPCTHSNLLSSMPGLARRIHGTGLAACPGAVDGRNKSGQYEGCGLCSGHSLSARYLSTFVMIGIGLWVGWEAGGTFPPPCN